MTLNLHVAITGASSGIGEALVREFAAIGARLTLIARREQHLERVAHDVGKRGNTFICPTDLADVARCCNWIVPSEAALGPVDVLVNNAGVQIIRPAANLNADECEYLIALNLRTPLRLTCRLLPDMMARRTGTIVNITSIVAIAPMPGMFYYNAAKAALANSSEGLRGELLGTGVHIVTAYAGLIDTAMKRDGVRYYEDGIASSLAPVGHPDVFARLIRLAVERRRPRIIYPRLYSVAERFPRIARWCTSHFSPSLRSGALDALEEDRD